MHAEPTILFYQLHQSVCPSVCLSVCLSVHAGIVSKRTHNCTFVDRLVVASLISELRRSYKNPMGTLKYTGLEKFAIFATEVSE